MKGIARRMSMATVVRVIVILPVCGILAWDITVTALGSLAARARSPQLLAVFADHPDAGTELSGLLITTKQFAAAETLAKDTVETAPLNSRALTSLGFALRGQGEEAKALPILRQAASLGWQHTAILVWALEDAARNDDAVRIVDVADALARRQRVGSLTRAVFLGALEEPRMQRRFVERLAERPSWRAGFFADVRDRLAPKQFDGMEAVLRALRTTKAPPTPTEFLTYVDRMVQLGAIDRARRYWAETAGIPPAELAREPFDGRFARVAGGGPDAPASVFEWRINPDLSDLVTFVADQGGSALRIEPGIDDGVVVASQVLALSPGEHVLQAKHDGSAGAVAPAGWTITCLNASQPLLRTIVGDRRDELSRVAVTIPAANCPAQTLRLVGNRRLDAQPVTITAVEIR
jgi:hypothetical protein